MISKTLSRGCFLVVLVCFYLAVLTTVSMAQNETPALSGDPKAVEESSPAETRPTATEEEPAPSAESGSETETEGTPADGESSEASEDAAESIEETVDETVEAAEEDPSASIAELIGRFPELGAVMHSAAVHMPIALWVFGGLFVVIGWVKRSWADQIPLACLIGGALFSVGAVATGWWVGEYEWGSDWREVDWEETIVQHRWSAVSAMALSFVLSLIAIVNQWKQSASLGFIWRAGLLALAVWIAWIGHLGGELMKGEGFFEEALEMWLNGE